MHRPSAICRGSALGGPDLFFSASCALASRVGAAQLVPRDGTRHCDTRSFTILVTNDSFITTSAATMSGPKPFPSPARRSPNGLKQPTATVLFESA